MNNSLLVMHELIKTTDLMGKVNTLLASVPNPYLLTYILESVDSLKSNEIENIHTTFDEAMDEYIIKNDISPFVRYRETLKQAHIRLEANVIIRSQDIEWINKNLRDNDEGYRKGPVTIKNSEGNIIHKPVAANELQKKMSELIDLINNDNNDLKILHALKIHHIFEQIHPFNDGNGRTGRILLALLLSKYNLLNVPASVLSFAIAKDKQKYYNALKHADKGDMDTYNLNMLQLLNISLETSIEFIKNYLAKIKQVKENTSIPSKYYSFIDTIFVGIKTTNKYISKKMNMNNKTVTKYIEVLVDEGIMEIKRKGRTVKYVNQVLNNMIHKYYFN